MPAQPSRFGTPCTAHSRTAWAAVAALACLTGSGRAVEAAPASPATVEAARGALERAVSYYRGRVATHGGYVYYCSLDFRQRWGEGAVTPDQIFVQPPGTPAVGMAYLKAYDATGDRRYLQSAQEAGRALLHGQLESGGWTQAIDFDPKGTLVGRYRNGKGKRNGRNTSTLDDGISQAAIRFLARLDRALEFKDGPVHDGALASIEALLKAQFPNGGFPQVWTGPATAHGVLKAGYAESWPRTWPHGDYWNYYTLNDNVAGNTAAALQEALEVYRDDRCRQALVRLGDFLLLAQMPEPQPGWAQQYDYEMHPVWARKFEPPAVAGRESQDAIETLMRVYRLTGERKYLEPIPRALEFLRRSRLPDGRLSRYYELKTNRPLYMNRKNGTYFLTYDDTDLPDHYGWKTEYVGDRLERELEDLRTGRSRPGPALSLAKLESEARSITTALDPEGRWVSSYGGERLTGQPRFAPGFRYLDSEVFCRNVEALAAYLSAAAPPHKP